MYLFLRAPKREAGVDLLGVELEYSRQYRTILTCCRMYMIKWELGNVDFQIWDNVYER